MRATALTQTLLMTFILFLGNSQASAASVSHLKGQKVLIQLEGDSAQPGQEFYVLNSDGKKVAIVKISQVKNGKATADVTKGTPVLGGSLKPRPSGTATSEAASPEKAESASAEPNSPSIKKRKKISGGVLGGYALNSMALTVQNPSTPAIKEEAKLTDSSFSVKAFADYDFSPDFTARVATGWESFAVKGSTASAICSNGASKNCTVAFDYLTLEGSAHYNFINGKTRVWAGLGYAFLIQLAKNVDVPNLSSDGGQNQMIMLSTGADIALSGGKFIPLVLEYGMFPGSSNVVANAIYLRGGYGFTF